MSPRQQSICPGYEWGVTIDEVKPPPYPVYNQYIHLDDCRGPASVQSSNIPNAPLQIRPFNEVFECVIPAESYFCGSAPVRACCGQKTSPT
ncbi:hypothetical protein BV22DRAFT_1130933 [Leucogyrophana mollusca]|uniref:Uncharacterized protein n=1 Tax=Leucogyrophana mollusca TaxID=85980 RepID=A0ACB8BEE8_9AGAM|nr:hypothetical protein BV22DRAFT_1130933 [Leucogyrophana mollusca]